MLRRVALSLIVVLLCVTLVQAAKIKIEVKGKVKSIDNEKTTITVAVSSAQRRDGTSLGAKEMTVKVTEKTEFVDAQGGKLADGLKSKEIKEGVDLAIAGETGSKKNTMSASKITLGSESKDKSKEPEK